MKRIIVLLFVISIITLGCGSKVENKTKNGVYKCTRPEEAGGEFAEATVYIEITNDKISKAYSTLKFETDEAYENVCEGLEISYQHASKKIDYECNDKTVKFLDYFQVKEKKDYTYEELTLDLRSIGYDCRFSEKE